MKILFALFLIAHGLIHASFLQNKPTPTNGGPEWPFDLTKSWIFTPMGVSVDTIKIMGIVLVITATVGFLISGLGWLGLPFLKDIWVPVTVCSSILSILLLVIFWHNWFVVGPIIDLVLLYLIFFRDWKVA